MSSNRAVVVLSLLLFSSFGFSQEKRARDYGIEIGIFNTGALNAITDVKGVAVGHTTLIEGDSIRTGVTAIVPHQKKHLSKQGSSSNIYREWFWKAHGLFSS